MTDGPSAEQHEESFEKSEEGFVGFLLFDGKGFPLLVLETRAADKNPLVGKEKAR